MKFLEFIPFAMLISPLLFASSALLVGKSEKRVDSSIRRLFQTVSLLSILVFVACGSYLIGNEPLQSQLLGYAGLGLSVRLDAISIIMSIMVSVLSLVIIRFSLNYLDGEGRHREFLRRLAFTIASVQLLIMAGNLLMILAAWYLTSFCLHKLLLTYRDRKRARMAAAKKFLLARASDILVLFSFLLIYIFIGSGELSVLFQDISSKPDLLLEASGIFLALAVLLKSAQFPFHSWLVEVTETPTPVSALLHAGLLNAGPFLILRLSMFFDTLTIAPIILIVIGGVTAIFASAAYLTQPLVKNALAYSSAAHMGFSLLTCGTGLYAAAMLHLVAHSFYKAHSFLSSGSVVDIMRNSKIHSFKRKGNPIEIFLGVSIAGVLFFIVANLIGFGFEVPIQLLMLSELILISMALLVSLSVDSNSSIPTLISIMIMPIVVFISFFALEYTFDFLLHGLIPSVSSPGEYRMIAMILIYGLFNLTIFIQIISPWIPKSEWIKKFEINLRYGFYSGAYLDRMVMNVYPELKKNTNLR